jgi:hypothetical protein
VLRELQTLSGHPNQLHEWTRAAFEIALNRWNMMTCCSAGGFLAPFCLAVTRVSNAAAAFS